MIVLRQRALLTSCALLVAVHAAADSPLTLSLVGPGSSASDPALGTTVQLQVTCAGGAAACPPWIRIDRTDGISDTTPLVRVVDEAYTFSWAPTFPYFFRPAWGVNTFWFGGSVDNTPISIVGSGWTDKYNGTMVGDRNSSALVIHYSLDFENSNSTLLVQNLGPGSARLRPR